MYCTVLSSYTVYNSKLLIFNVDHKYIPAISSIYLNNWLSSATISSYFDSRWEHHGRHGKKWVFISICVVNLERQMEQEFMWDRQIMIFLQKTWR